MKAFETSTQKTTFFNARFFAVCAMVLVAAALRLVPHLPNFSPITGMALFAGAYFTHRTATQKLLAILLPLAALVLSDAVLGFHSQIASVYISFMLVTAIGFGLGAKSKPVRLVGASLAGSTLFFGITNFAVWKIDGLYPKTGAGLATCYLAAVPFFQNAIVGDLVFTGTFFGVWALATRRFPALTASQAI